MNKLNPRAKPLELILILGALSTRMEKVSHRSVRNLVLSPGAPISSVTVKRVKNCIIIMKDNDRKPLIFT